MEAGGIEPPSESASEKLSTRIVCHLYSRERAPTDSLPPPLSRFSFAAVVGHNLWLSLLVVERSGAEGGPLIGRAT